MSFWNKLVDRFRGGEGEEIDWEALLIEADLGVKLATEWVEEIKEKGLTRSPEKAETFLREKMLKLVRIPPPLPILQKPEVILLIGVNGSGKTTTAAKLGARARQEGRTVHLGAADTFRAAAAEQLEAWGARLEIPVTSAAPGTDPASVAVRSLLAAQESKTDLLIIDTAGRQANKRNLLLELGKIKRSLQKKVEAVPHHTWLVADGVTGFREIGTLAAAYGKRVIPHHGGGNIGTVAQLHAIASWPNAPWIEILHDPPIAAYTVGFAMMEGAPMVDKDGYMNLPQAPGWGVGINKAM